MINAIILEVTMAGAALYFILIDMRMAEAPAFHVVFLSIFLAAILVAAICLSVNHERSVRREFAAIQAVGRSQRD